MKVLVTGGTGLLGWWITKTFIEKGFKVYATYHSKRPADNGDVEWVRMDLADLENVADVARSVRPQIVIHCAAYTDVDGCETNRKYAYRVNYLGTKALAQVAKSLGAYVVYVSTDYVFDGEKGMYKENDTPNPVNYYGLTKLLGEVAVGNALEGNSCIVRVSGLYGYSPTGKRNFGINALERLLRGEEVRAFRDQYLSPTYVVPLSESIAKIVEQRATGVLHIAGERMSRYGFALLLAKALSADSSLVKPVPMNEARLVARRPRDSSLDTSRAHSLGLALPSQATCVKHFIELYRELRGA